MQDVIFALLFTVLMGAPGIIWLVLRKQTITGRFWMAPVAAAVLTVLLGGAMLNRLAGWPEAWGFLIVWLVACALAWWVPAFQRNRRGRLAAEARERVGDEAETAKTLRRKARNKRKK